MGPVVKPGQEAKEEECKDGYVSRECDRYTLHQDWLTPAIWLLKSQAKKDNASIYKLKTTEVRIWYTG